MSRRYFKKNVDQFDLFDLVAQLSEIKEFRSAEAELSMVYWLRQSELNMIETKKKSTSKWTQISIESIFDDVL
jgi:UDP-N-acetylglucosamine pyrophosphorylase